VSRQALCNVLQKHGVPDFSVDLVNSFHDGMAATVSVSGDNAPPFEVRIVLRQVCSVAPNNKLSGVGYVAVIQWELRCFIK